MSAKYGELSQHDNDDNDQNDGLSSPIPLSPARSSSPMPFLPAFQSTFTPLSTDSSDLYSGGGIGVRGKRENHANNGSRAITGAGASIGAMVQSLSSARATYNKRSEYGLLSPGTTSSSPSSSPKSPNLNNSSVNVSPETKFASKNVNIRNFNPNATTDSTLLEEKEPRSPRSQDPQQPLIFKPKPIIRTASKKIVPLRHPTPDLNTRSSSYASNIAQLEATAEKLSMTSSIEDAIRDLHEEQKRNDSRRSSILAASIGSIPENDEPLSFPVIKPLMSPDNSALSNITRVRSGSGPFSRPEVEAGNVMSRHGPGKSSVRSVRSASKPTLTDIAELEPTTLTPAAMDEADKLAEDPGVEEMLRIPELEDIDLTPNAEQYGASNNHDYWGQPIAENRASHVPNIYDNRSRAGSTATYDQAEGAFADFDGAHCPSDIDLEDSLFMSSLSNGPVVDMPFLRPFDRDLAKNEEEPNPSRPVISRPIGPPTVRPKSYMDPESGNTMMYYPARVPLMLNLPQKLSKKPKAEVRNARRSQILSKMSEPNREPGAPWLPEMPFETLGSEPTPASAPLAGPDADAQMTPASGNQREIQPGQNEGAGNNEAHVTTVESDKRKSKLDGLPPQLRASVFFDLPASEVPAIQLKDGSAMATLDSILDASAKAPVSAFTDHAFAGSLGSEVYGAGKKRKSHLKVASATDLLEPKKRSSFLHLRKPSALSRHSDTQEERRNTIAGGTRMDERLGDANGEDEERQRLSGSIDGRTPEQEEGEDSEEEPLYNGPPTTLLAELQIRKQQHKLRTRPITSAFPNGMHSTLLEMDTVAQIEHKNRKGRKINLAWEDPNLDAADNSEDDDTPLGLLMVAKGQGNDMIAALAEINRPPGLMERREMEDNEPLSRRRDRLQGREVGPVKRQSMMTLGHNLHNPNGMNGNLRPPSPQLQVHGPEEEEIEGETLGERMRRLKAREQADNLLPQARPVSSSFSAELLGQISDAFKADDSGGKEDNRKVKPKEEEETLGQRRRRLQAEREAHEHSMAGIIPSGELGNDTAKVKKRRSLADVLGAHGSKAVLSDPRVEAERAKQEEGARYRQDQDQKIAALRSQIPSSISTPNLNRAGGFMAGRFNDGTGGSGQRTSTALGANGGVGGTAYPIASGPGGTMPYEGQPQQPGHMDRVERWRQSILP